MLQPHLTQRPELALSYLHAPRPTTVIFSHPQGLAPELLAEDYSVAFRIPNDPFCQQLLQAFGGPLIATSANLSQHPTPKQFSEIDPAILKGVDYIVPLSQDQINAQPSRIVKVNPDGTATILRD